MVRYPKSFRRETRGFLERSFPMEIQQISQQAVEASAVLLKNQGMLPLAPGKQVAFFGWAQWDPVLSGNGSGASHSGRNPSFVESCREATLR